MESQEEDTRVNTHIKFLVSNAEAGAIIGKGGSTIGDFQLQSGARISLSRSWQFFPGTTERIVTVCGTIDDMLTAVDLILSKLLDVFCDKVSDDVELTSSLRIIVPSSSCGGLIGKGGATIRSFKEESRADIIVSPRDNTSHGPNNRLVIIDGTIDEQMMAVDMILSKLSEDLHYFHCFDSSFPYAEEECRRPMSGSDSVGCEFESNEADWNSSTVFVLDKYVGHLIGRGGRNLKEIIQATGARITISEREGSMIPTSERTITITGPEQAVCDAEDLILDQITSAEILVDGGEYGYGY